MTGRQIFNATLVVLTTLVGGYLLISNVHILIVLVIAIIIASALRPMAARFQRWGLSAGLSITLTYLPVAVAILTVLLLVAAPVVQQFANYLQNESFLANRMVAAKHWLEATAVQITRQPVSLGDEDALRQSVFDTIEQVRTSAPSTLVLVGNTLGEAILVFVMGVYWLTSRDKAVTFFANLFPHHRREEFLSIFGEIETTLGSYVRGIVLVASFVALANTVLLMLFRVPNAAVLGFIVGVTTMLPIVGGFIGAGIAVFLAVLTSPVYGLIVLGVFAAVQQLEMHIVTPRVMARSVGIDPLLVILAVFIGFAMYGTTGAIIAVPIAGTLAILFQHLYVTPRQAELEYRVVDGGVLLATPPPAEPPAVVERSGESVILTTE